VTTAHVPQPDQSASRPSTSVNSAMAKGLVAGRAGFQGSPDVEGGIPRAELTTVDSVGRTGGAAA
jgi:hypothetical protein